MLSRFQRFLSILILPFLQVLLGQQLVFIQNAENFTVFFPGQIALEKIKIKGLQTESSFWEGAIQTLRCTRHLH